MYVNHGDKNFFDVGILVDTEHSDTVFDMLLCKPYEDEEDLFQFAHVQVDIEDDWIEREKVMNFCGMTEEDFDPVQFAIGCTDWYPWENFGAGSFAYSYDWTHMTRKQIYKELRNYLIASDNLEMPWLDPPKKFVVTVKQEFVRGNLTLNNDGCGSYEEASRKADNLNSDDWGDDQKIDILVGIVNAIDAEDALELAEKKAPYYRYLMEAVPMTDYMLN